MERRPRQGPHRRRPRQDQVHLGADRRPVLQHGPAGAQVPQPTHEQQ